MAGRIDFSKTDAASHKLGARRPLIARRVRISAPYAALVADIGAVSVAVLAALVLRGQYMGDPLLAPRTASLAGPVIVVLWVTSLLVLGAYRRMSFVAGPDEFKATLNAGLLTGGLVGVASFVTGFNLSRGFFALLMVIGILGTLLERFVLRRVMQRAHRAGLIRERVLLIGSPHSVDDVAGVLSRERWLGWDVVGALSPAAADNSETGGGVPLLGQVDDVAGAVTKLDVDTIVVSAGAHGSSGQLRELVWELESQDVRMVVAPSLTDISSDRVRMRPVGGLALIHLDPPTHADAGRIGKRLFDIFGALALIVMCSPVMAVAALWIRINDRGPVFFRQHRVGRGGVDFNCLKLRTMVTDAEKRLDQLKSEQDFGGGMFKMERDPRVTSPGRFLRRLSLDELPQLFNVLRGDMSLVGPRPPLPSEVEQYEGHTARRLHVRPGITGLWQVSGRSDLTWEESIRLDLYYVDNWSLLQDLNILFKTVSAVVSSRGAY